MDLILWRHAEARQGLPDEARALNAKGRKQASRMASWLNANLPENCRILVSPATRTVQTAEALGRKFRLHPDLSPDSTPEAILAAANWPKSRETVLIVGHQPALGQIAAMLIAGLQQDWRIRRGNIWWIAHRERGESVDSAYLRAVIAPEFIVPVEQKRG
jgi:phosphohistidine phosphatase